MQKTAHVFICLDKTPERDGPTEKAYWQRRC